jgi:hypothetical protein
MHASQFSPLKELWGIDFCVSVEALIITQVDVCQMNEILPKEMIVGFP